MSRLAARPRIGCLLVEADYADVLDRVRGEATAAHESGLKDPATAIELFELHGDAAQVHRPFGREAHYWAELPGLEFISDVFDLRGWRRVSRLRCNPGFVLFEEELDTVRPFMDLDLAVWTGGRVFGVMSQIAPYGLSLEHEAKLMVNFAVGQHTFLAVDQARKRSVSYLASGTGAGSKRFHAQGEPWDFEDSYEGLKPRERITRDRICLYLERLGIDPESLFERRELDDPVLFTTDHAGPSACIYRDAADRYRRSINGDTDLQKIQAGTWF